MPASLDDRISHIKEAIAGIRLLRNRAAEHEIRRDPILRAALERFFEVVSEASRHIPDGLKASHPHVPWRQIAGIGNVLRHAYDGVDLDLLLNASGADLDILDLALDAMRGQDRGR